MTPLVILIVVFAVASLWLRRRGNLALAGRIALAAMLVLTGVSHFTMTEALAQMIPPVLPEPTLLVLVTGVLELALALALLARPSRALGWVLAALFVALLPANIYSALAGVGYGAHGAAYLWFRVPLQVLFVAWALVSTGVLTLRRRAASPRGSDRTVALAVRRTGRRGENRTASPSRHASAARS